MGIFESWLFYGESIIKTCVAFGLSIAIFSYYNRRIWMNLNKQNTPNKRMDILFYRLLCILPVALWAGIRGYITGADTHNVWKRYIECMYEPLTERLSQNATSVLFEVFRWMVCWITDGNVQAYLTLLAGITMYFVVSGIEKWHLKYGGLGLFAFYCCFGLQLLNQARQLLAVAILFYAYQYSYERNKKYFIYAIVAGLIHISSLPAAAMIWYLQKRKVFRSRKIVYYITLALVCVAMPVLISLSGSVLAGTKYTMYAESAAESKIGLGLFLTLLPTVFPIMIFQKKLSSDNKMRDVICMTLPMRLAGYTSYFVYRMFYFFGIVNAVAFPYIVEHSPKRSRWFYCNVICFVCIAYFLIYYCWTNAYVYFPYTTFLESWY